MKHKYAFTAALLLCIIIGCYILTSVYVKQEQEQDTTELRVVTSFYPMYVAAANIIGDNPEISLENLSEPQTGCLHDYQLTPEDMKLLSEADIFIINGGGIESFLAEAAKENPNLTIIDASKDIDLLGENAHAWMSVSLYSKQINTISQGLKEIDKGNADSYEANVNLYQKKLKELEEQQQEIKKVASGSNIVLFHEAYEYVAEDYGIKVLDILDLDEERQVSAGEVAKLLTTIKENNISIVLAEELYGSEMGDTVEKETPVKVYYLDTLVRGDYKKDSYIQGMQKNIDILKQAFGVK